MTAGNKTNVVERSADANILAHWVAPKISSYHTGRGNLLVVRENTLLAAKLTEPAGEAKKPLYASPGSPLQRDAKSGYSGNLAVAAAS